MNMVQVINNEIVQCILPTNGTLKDGRTVFGYCYLDDDTLKKEGWIPVEDILPKYNEETQYVVLHDKVVKKYRIEDIIEPEPAKLDIIGQEVTILKLDNIQKDSIIDSLGQELTNIKLQLIMGGM